MMNATTLLLWPRFQAIMDMHIESIKKLSAQKLCQSKDTQPHFCMRRYAEFAVSILVLNDGYEDGLLNYS